MIVTINGQDMHLNPREVRSAKKIITGFMDRMRKHCAKSGMPTYFFTFLVVLHVMSQEALNTYDSKNMAFILETLEEERKKAENNKKST